MADKEKRFRKILNDKDLKTLERVIKQKCKFLGNTNDSEYRWAKFNARFGSKRLIYVSNTTIETANIKTLLEEMEPLYVYIISYVLYKRLHFTWKNLRMKINFRTMISADTDDFCFHEEEAYKSPLGDIRSQIKYIEEEEKCYISFQKPLRIEIRFDRRKQQEVFYTQINQSDSDDSSDEENLQSDREIQEEVEATQSYSGNSGDEENLQIDREIQEEVEASQSYSDDSKDEEEELSINNFKTFKSDQCVICLEEKPKVLFCNCGHLCICEKCFVHRFDNCPVCKKENTIVRIIE